MEKPQTLWHGLKLHPYGPDAEGKKARRETVVSQNYEEVLFNEPVEQFYDLLTGGAGVAPQQAKGKSTKGKQAQLQSNAVGGRTAEIPHSDSPKNPYSQKTEAKELDRIIEATKTVEKILKDEKAKLMERERVLAGLKETEGTSLLQKKR